MKKTSFIALIMGVVGSIIFAPGVCMCLLPEWQCLKQGILLVAIGAVILAGMIIVLRNSSEKSSIKLDAKAIFTVFFGIFSALVFGVGICLAMVWGEIAIGAVTGISGIILLLCLIPLCKGLK